VLWPPSQVVSISDVLAVVAQVGLSRAGPLIVIALAGLAAAAVPMVGFPYGKHNPKAFAHVYTEPSTGLVAHLHIDADITNGARPCDPLDSTATVTVGSTQAVGVCLEDYQANDVQSFQIRLTNNDALNFAPDPQGDEEVKNGGTGPDCATVGCLDDNPDANDGDSPAGLKLGSNWDCTGTGYLRPRSETLPIELVCNANVLSPDMDLSANPGLLATVTFDALAGGVDTLTFASDTAIGMASAQDGSCGDDPDYLIGCFGATIHKVAAPTPMPTITPTDTPAPGPVGGIAEFPDIPSASAEEAPGPAEGSDWLAGDYALAGGLAAPILAVAAGVWYTRRRSLR